MALSDGFALLSAKNALIQVYNRSGDLLGTVSLDEQLHRQAEGIGWLSDGRLIIADEGNKSGSKPGLVRVYIL